MCIIIDLYEDLPKRSKKRVKLLDETTEDLIKIFPDQSVTHSATRAQAIRLLVEAAPKSKPFVVLNDGVPGTPLHLIRRWITKNAGNSKHGGASGTGPTPWAQNKVNKTIFEKVFGPVGTLFKHTLYARGEGKEAVDAEVERGLRAYSEAHPEASAEEVNKQRPGLLQEAASRAFNALPKEKQAEYEAEVKASGFKPPP